MAIKISVLTLTCREGMLATQAEALSKQTFKDFEWIIVDDLYDKRPNISQSWGFPVTHMTSSMPKDYAAPGEAANDALCRASGELVYFMADYILPMPNSLARHWELHQKYPKAFLSGCVVKVETPISELKEDTLNKLVGRDYRSYLFERGHFQWLEIEPGLYEVPRAGVQNWWAGRNDSAPLEALLECNGFDEGFDGRWGGHDADMANRLMTYGLRYLIDKHSYVLEFPHVSGGKRPLRSEAKQQEFQYTVINKRVTDEEYRANIDWYVLLPRDIKAERKVLHKEAL